MMKKYNKENPELDTARNNFSNLLKNCSKKNANEDNNHVNSSSLALTSSTDYDEDYDSGSPSQKSKRLKGSRKTKKRINEDEFVQQSTCMLKLFDRTIDLAQFKDNTPLYKLCRAWVKNPIDNSKDSDSDNNDEMQSDSMEVDDKDNLIFSLPEPEPSNIDLRIPKSIKKPNTSAKEIDKAINSLKNEKLSTILEMNKKRWKDVREEWKKASLENEKRYKKSWLILKEMYDKTITIE